MILNPFRLLRIHRINREIDIHLARRKSQRAARSQAACKGWQTRKAKV